MRRARHSKRLLAAATGGLILFGGSALAELAGPPRIVDGDTLEIAGQRVRLFGVDAPELDQVSQRAGHDYHCGRVARAALWDLVGGADVSCQPEGATPARDGVVLANCSAGGVSLNEGMIRAGWALADPQAPERYLAIQADAEQARRGLWRGEFEPPGSGGRRRRRGMDDAARRGAAPPAHGAGRGRERFMDETRAIARLPHLEIEIRHRRLPEEQAEQLAISLRATPSFQVFAEFLERQAPWPWLALQPWLLSARMVQASWQPWLAARAAASAARSQPPSVPERHDRS